MSPLSTHARGLLITGFGVLVITPDGLLTRLIAADSWTLTFWRGLLSGIGMCLILSGIYRRQTWTRVRAIGWPGIWVALIFSLGSVAFVFAITHTTVANALFLVNTSPAFTVLVAWGLIGEPVPRRTWGAIAAVMFGIGVIAFTGERGGGSVTGDAAAIVAALSIAFSLSLTRHYRERDMVPAMALAGFMTALIALPFGNLASIEPDARIYLALMGLVMLPLAFGLMYLGPRYLPAAEVNLILLLEAILGPLWVWLAIGEHPGWMTLVGGGIILAALSFNAMGALAQGRQQPGKSTVAADRDHMATQ